MSLFTYGFRQKVIVYRIYCSFSTTSILMKKDTHTQSLYVIVRSLLSRRTLTDVSHSFYRSLTFSFTWTSSLGPPTSRVEGTRSRVSQSLVSLGLRPFSPTVLYLPRVTLEVYQSVGWESTGTSSRFRSMFRDDEPVLKFCCRRLRCHRHQSVGELEFIPCRSQSTYLFMCNCNVFLPFFRYELVYLKFITGRSTQEPQGHQTQKQKLKEVVHP